MSNFILVSIMFCFNNGSIYKERCAVHENKYVKAARIEEMTEETARVCTLKPNLQVLSYENLTQCHLQKICRVYGISNGGIEYVAQSCGHLARASNGR